MSRRNIDTLGAASASDNCLIRRRQRRRGAQSGDMGSSGLGIGRRAQRPDAICSYVILATSDDPEAVAVDDRPSATPYCTA